MLRALPILLLAGLGGCIYNPHQDFSPDFGDSVRANIASQVIYPIPLKPSRTAGTDGVHQERAFDRYQNNRVYRPEAVQSLQTTSGTSGGGGGGAPSAPGAGGGSGSGGGSSPY